MIFPMLMCTFAGLSTGLGAVLVTAMKGITKERMSAAQGFAAGVMITISLTDLVPESFKRYCGYMSAAGAAKAVAMLFICGCVAGIAISELPRKSLPGEDADRADIRRSGLITTVVMVLHNLPEGMLTMFTGVRDITFGLRTALAVALHNLPEGMAIAAPVYYTTSSGKKAFVQSVAAGMAEPFGGIMAWLLLKNVMSSSFLNGFLPLTAGIMCRAAATELIPTATKLSGVKHMLAGFAAGVIIMLAGLAVL